MHPFTYAKPGDLDAASDAGRADDARFVNGGTTMMDLMRLHVWQPETVVDLKSAGLPDAVEEVDGHVRIGAGARMSKVAQHELIVEHLPMVRESLLLAASPQIRNMASIGGNLLQQTRCPYFRHPEWRCNRREPGSGCDAIDGDNRGLAVLGTSEACIASYPGDLAVALVACDATLHLRGPDGERSVKIRGFHKKPGDTPHVQTELRPGEIIVGVDVPLAAAAKRSTYVKARDRASYAFANASAAVGLELDGETIADCRVALGGVGSVPWHSPEAEAALRGKPATAETFAAAADAALAGARGHGENDFKIPLAKNVLVRALEVLTATAAAND